MTIKYISLPPKVDLNCFLLLITPLQLEKSPEHQGSSDKITLADFLNSTRFNVLSGIMYMKVHVECDKVLQIKDIFDIINTNPDLQIIH